MRTPSPLKVKAQLAELESFMEKHRRATEKATVVGREAADLILSNLDKEKKGGTESRAIVLSEVMRSLTACEPDPECENLLLEWSFERYWGIEVGNHLPLFDEAYQRLRARNATAADPLVWGDIDCGAWIEPAADDRKVIALTVYCSAADDNTWLYIHEADTVSVRFHVRTVYPKISRLRGHGKRAPGWSVSLLRPSIKVYREVGFKPQYGDCRDMGYQLSYQQYLFKDIQPPKVDRAYSFGSNVYWALWNLRGIHDASTSS